MKTLVSQETYKSIGLRKKICFKISRIFILENVIFIFVKNLVNVGKKLEIKLQYFDIGIQWVFQSAVSISADFAAVQSIFLDKILLLQYEKFGKNADFSKKKLCRTIRTN